MKSKIIAADDAECQVNLNYDNEAQVWTATSDDVTGLILESESPEILMKRVVDAIPELIELNNLPKYKAVNFSMTRRERVAIFTTALSTKVISRWTAKSNQDIRLTP